MSGLFYSLGLLLALAVSAPWWLTRMATNGKYREGLAERLGRVPGRLRGPGARPVIWLHAVSVGEVLAASRLVEELRARLSGWRVVVSTTTRTGQQLARQRFSANDVFYFPLDFAFPVRAYLRALRPRLLVLMETEFWPRMLAECRRAGVPVAVVNARISDRSWPRYRRLRFLWTRLLGGLAVVLAQTEIDAQRLKALGAGRVQVAGNLKYDIRETAPARITVAVREHLPPGARIIVCGSTLEGEEQILLVAAPPEAVLVLAPRHPERFEEVVRLLERSGRRWVRRSQWLNAPEKLLPGTVLLLDSIGELASLYSLASVAFVGGSLVAAGGHNPLEPAQFGVPIVMGPHYENFRGIVERLRESDAIRIVAESELKAAMKALFEDGSLAAAMGARARQVFASEAGATKRAVAALMEVLGERA